jgi:heme exporter protein A
VSAEIDNRFDPGNARSPAVIDALELHDLECTRGHRLLFSAISARVVAGQLLRVQGENGAGKTSLLRMICGLASPSRGEVRWRGRPIAKQRDEFNAGLAYLGHAPALKDDLSGLENLQAACGLAGMVCTAEAAMQALAQAGLQGRERLPVRALSQGQRKRAALARLVLVGAAPIWVLDEPFNALDDAACGWLQALIAAQLARGGVVVLTNHQAAAWDAAQPQVAIRLQAPAPAMREPAAALPV